MNLQDEPGDSNSANGRSAHSGALLDRLVHDLKQPLNHIRVVAQDVRIDVGKNRLEIESVPESMREIEEAVSQLATMLDRLHQFAPKTTSESELRTVDLAAMSEQVIARICESSEGVSISKTLAPGSSIETQDPSALEQALWEILDNACRAARIGGHESPCVEVSTFARGEFIVVAIRDNGGGVEADSHAAIFEPFFSTQEQSSGLGLSLALALIVKVGGELELTESSERGSCFEIRLPNYSKAVVGGRK